MPPLRAKICTAGFLAEVAKETCFAFCMNDVSLLNCPAPPPVTDLQAMVIENLSEGLLKKALFAPYVRRFNLQKMDVRQPVSTAPPARCKDLDADSDSVLVTRSVSERCPASVSTIYPPKKKNRRFSAAERRPMMHMRLGSLEDFGGEPI